MFINEMLMKMVYYLEVFKPWFSSGVYNYFIEKKPSVFSWLSTYTVHAMQSGNALQLTNHILKWCFRVSTGCPVVFFILEEENTGPYLDRRFTSLVSIFDCCFYHAITAIEYAEDIPLINYQNLTCCARCKIKKLHLENNELQRQLFNNTALNLKYDRFSKCKKKKEKEDFIFQFCLMFY